MTKWTQQMPLMLEVGNLQALTTEEIAQIKKYIEQGTILDVQFVDGDGEVMIPVGFTPEVEGDESTTPATVTVVKNGSVVKASVEPTFVKFGLIMPDDSIGSNGDSKSVFFGALFSDGEVKLCIDKTANTKCPLGSATKAENKYGSAAFTISPSPATTSTTIAIDTIPNVKDVKALDTYEVEQELDATDGLQFNGEEIPVEVKVDDTTPVSHTIGTGDVIMTWEK